MIEALLATQLAGVLAPHLSKLMDPALETISGKVGDAAWNKAVSIWKIIKPEMDKQPEVAKAIQEVSSKPNDPRAESMLSWQLEKLTFSPGTLTDIQKLLGESKTEIRNVTATGGSVASGGNMSENVIITNADKK